MSLIQNLGTHIPGTSAPDRTEPASDTTGAAPRHRGPLFPGAPVHERSDVVTTETRVKTIEPGLFRFYIPGASLVGGGYIRMYVVAGARQWRVQGGLVSERRGLIRLLD